MLLHLSDVVALLKQNNLLHEVIESDTWTTDASKLSNNNAKFTDITYDTRTVKTDSLLFCKGRFSPNYIADLGDVLSAYVSEIDYSNVTSATGIIVSDIRKSMALLSAAFYGMPQNEITVIGITGTKGKTTTAYFTHTLLSTFSNGKAALFSSVDNCVNGKTFVESDLTTPESMDLFRMMREAVDNGMKYLVMEVSSQAYKIDRVYGLTFDVGVFLNISPDHLSDIEHPTFDDYFFCKRQIINNSKVLVTNSKIDHYGLICEDAARNGIDVLTFTADDSNSGNQALDASVSTGVSTSASTISAQAIDNATGSNETGKIILDNSGAVPVSLGEFHLAIDGDFNYENAAAAIAIAKALGIDFANKQAYKAIHSIESVKIAGRMETYTSKDGVVGIVDYAHNFISTKVLLEYVLKKYGAANPRIILVTGSAGNKAYDRRTEIVEAAQDIVSRFIFTVEDTDTEPPYDICKQMEDAITNPTVEHSIIINRSEAMEAAVADAREHVADHPVIVAIGKGDERWIKDRNVHVEYEGDDRIIARLLSE